MRDVANVRDGYTPQLNMVVSNGIEAALLPVLKNGDASTLDVVSRLKAALPAIAATLPPALEIKPLFDQSVFVSTALADVIQEAVTAAALTAAMILLFLGSWRSTLVVPTSIPLSICCSVLVLHAMGQTISIMTLGGLALAVRILVDDATVEIENIHRNLGENFFPLVDAGQFRLHVRAPVGTRIEETQHVFSQVEGVIRSVIPKGEIDMVLANIGLPMNLNLALSDTATISSADGEILVSLNQQKHGQTWDYVKRIRQELIAKYPNHTIWGPSLSKFRSSWRR
jgi:multidrug efflux pump subunit AcrB